jgi:uncharacterized protein CbrC (UPF0167 family)
MDLPKFRYFADPVASGAIGASDNVCSCCGERRGLAYLGNVHPLKANGVEPETICAWCLADGSAAKKFDLEFVRALRGENLSDEVLVELTTKTPAFSTWQEPKWICHCQDACVFHGELSPQEAQNPNWTAAAEFLGESVEVAKSPLAGDCGQLPPG